MNNNLKIVMLTAVFGLSLFIVGCGKTQEAGGNQEETLIEERHEYLDKLFEEDPERIIDAQIVLQTYTSARILEEEIFYNSDLKVTAIYHGSENYGGGYSDLEDANTFQELYNKLLTIQLKSVGELIASAEAISVDTNNSMDTENLNNELNKLKDRKQKLQEEGVQIHALEVNGKVSDLKYLKDNKQTLIKLINPVIESGQKMMILPPQ